MEKLLLKPEEAAMMLGISRAKIYAMFNETDIPKVTFGKVWRVPVKALERWLEAQGMPAEKLGDQENERGDKRK